MASNLSIMFFEDFLYEIEELKLQTSTQLLLKQFDKFRTSQKLCDVTLISGVDGKSIKAHRLVLSVMSSYFLLLLSDTSVCEFTIKVVKGDILETFIKYFYNNCMQIKTENVKDLLIAARIFNVNEVVNACVSFISKRISVENCLNILNFAEYYKIHDLLENVEEFMCRNFYEFSYTNDFYKLTSKQFCKFISNDHLTVTSEEIVFHMIKSWTTKAENEQFLPGLLTMLRIPLLSNDFITKYVKQICRAINCQEIYVDEISSRLSPKSNENVNNKFRYLPRTSQLIGNFVALARNSKTQQWDILSYFMKSNTWKIWKKDITAYNNIVNCCLNDDKLFITDYNQIKCINLLNRKVKNVKNFQIQNKAPKLAVVNSFVYAIGGWSSKSMENSTSIEVWHPIKNDRYFAKEMPICLGAFEVVTIRDNLYIIGGFNIKTKDQLQLLRYNHTTCTWNILESMSEKRLNPGVAADDRYIYVVGGRFEKEVLSSVECYDTQNDKWIKIKPLSAPRYACGCVSIFNELYVVGGSNVEHKEMDNVEVYNKTTNCWSSKISMPDKYSYVSLVKPAFINDD